MWILEKSEKTKSRKRRGIQTPKDVTKWSMKKVENYEVSGSNFNRDKNIR